MDLFIKVYLNLIVLSFFTGLCVTAFRRKNGEKEVVKSQNDSSLSENVSSLQNNMEFFSGIDLENARNIVNVSEKDDEEYDIPVIYAVVDVCDTAEKNRAL